MTLELHVRAIVLLMDITKTQQHRNATHVLLPVSNVQLLVLSPQTAPNAKLMLPQRLSQENDFAPRNTMIQI